MAGGSSAAGGSGRLLEPGGIAGAGFGQLVGGRPRDRGWSLLCEASGDLADRQLEPVQPGGDDQPQALPALGRAGPLGGVPADRRHPGDGHHRERGEPLAGAGAAADPAIGAGETLRGAAGGQSVCPLVPDAPGSEAAVAGQLRGVAAADPQTAQPLHRRINRPDVVDGGARLRDSLAQPVRHRPCRRRPRHRQHLHQRVPAAAGGVVPRPLG